MRRLLSTAVASSALVGAVAIAPATATASGVSKVTISKVAPYWHGMVMSTRFGGNRSCEQKRLVKVFKQREGKDLLIGKDTSSKKGHWLVPGEPTKGRYYAILTARPAGKKPACLEDHSSVVDVG